MTQLVPLSVASLVIREVGALGPFRWAPAKRVFSGGVLTTDLYGTSRLTSYNLTI